MRPAVMNIVNFYSKCKKTFKIVEACCASNDANQCPGRYMGGKRGGKQNSDSLLVTYY